MRAGIIGFGLSGRTFHLPLLRAAGIEAASVAVRDPSGRAAEEGLRFVSVDDLCADPAIDVVVVASPNPDHPAHAVKALRAGKHAVVEKPLSLTPAGAREVARAAREAGRIASVFHNRRWDGDFLTLERVRRERFGEWAVFESCWRMGKPAAQQRWKDHDGMGGGLLADFMPHLGDQALRLFGEPDRAVLDSAVQRRGSPGADYAAITMMYGERRARLSADCFSATAAPRFRLAGPPGEYVCDGADNQESQLRRGVDPASPCFGAPDGGRTSRFAGFGGGGGPVPLERGGYATFYRDLRLAIEAGGPAPVPAHEAARVVEIIDALRRNAAWTAGEGRPPGPARHHPPEGGGSG